MFADGRGPLWQSVHARRPAESVASKMSRWMLEKVGSSMGVGPANLPSDSSQPAAPIESTAAAVYKPSRVIGAPPSSTGTSNETLPGLRLGLHDQRALHVFVALSAVLGTCNLVRARRRRHEINRDLFTAAGDWLVNPELLDPESMHAVS